MIENGLNLTKEDDNEIETQLEIHQIHNVIRTSNLRPQLIAPRPRPQSIIASASVPDMRRNSTTSSVSGVSTMLMNGSEINGNSTNGNGSNGNSNNNHNGNGFVHPPSKPFNVRPIQIKTEPIDPDYSDTSPTNGKQSQTTQSSPSNSSGSLSILTINSISDSSSASRVNTKTPPMIVINGLVSKNDKSPKKKGTNETFKPSPKIDRPPPRKVTQIQSSQKSKVKERQNPRNKVRDLRTIIKPPKHLESQKKLREAAKREMEKRKEAEKKKHQIKKAQQQQRKIQVAKKIVTKNGKIMGRPPGKSNKKANARGNGKRKS